MRNVLIVLICVCIVCSTGLIVFADSSTDSDFVEDYQFESVEESDVVDTEEQNEDDFVYRTDNILDDIFLLLYDRLPDPSLGESIVEEKPLEWFELEPPPIHELIPAPVGSKPVLFSIVSQSAYPYTGGAFIAMNTNYGNGIAVFVENYKTDTFGFIKGTDRVVNLSNTSVTGFWIMGGITYNLQAARLGEFQYYYNQGASAGWGWRTLSVSLVTDTNIQWLDETGIRGVQHPYFSVGYRFAILIVVLVIACVIVAKLLGGGL